MRATEMTINESGSSGKKALLGIAFALAIAFPPGVAYAMSCGCSGSACGGCTIYVTGAQCSCSTDCENCAIFHNSECTTGWECP